MKYLFVIIFLLLCTIQTFSQSFSVSGSVKSEKETSAFSGATILLEHPDNQTTIKGAITNAQGKFRLDSIKPGKYILIAQYVGFRPLRKEIDLQQQNLNLGALLLEEDIVTLDQVVITASVSAGVQKGDTTQFNAGAFKTLADASAQKLIEKMPGITMIDGKMQAQGEDVQQILVDGKVFFGNDVKGALQSLPAEVIAQVQIFDKKSDKAELSGFDDGEKMKTINIVTKPNRRRGQFGKSTLGYGSDKRYLLGANVNLFDNDRRITITGLSNNINALDYSADPNSQTKGNTQDGVIKANSIGINFSDDWGKKMEFSGSYLYNNNGNEGNASLIRNYLRPSDSGQVYTENNYSNRKNSGHRFNVRFEYNIDSNNRIIIRPNVSLQEDENRSYFSGRTVTDNGPLNQTENNSNSAGSNYDYTNSIYYSHRFGKNGRSFTLGINNGYHTNGDNANRLANNIFYGTEYKEETLNQHTTLDRSGISWGTNLSYTEPLGKKSQIELEYKIGNMLNNSDKYTYNLYEEDDPANPSSILDSALSNSFKSEYLRQEAEIGYQYSTKKLRLQVEAEYQLAKLKNDQFIPAPFDMQRTFGILLPTLRMNYKFSKSVNLEIDYDTWTNAPSIGQLQDVIDNSNPLHIRTGNPDLDQSMSNRLRLRYRNFNPVTKNSFFVYAASSFIKNNIVNSSTIAEEATEIRKGIVLEKGSQLSQPVNLNGYWDLRSYVSYGMPVELIKSNVGINGSVNYAHRPGLINNDINYVNSSNFRMGLYLSSNISSKIDFNISTRASYNLVENSIGSTQDNNYYNQSTRLSFDWIVWNGIVYRSDLNHQFNSGLSENYDNNILLLNMSLGKKVFQNERGEISLNVYDLLEQNSNLARNVTNLYVEDMRSNALQRYFMLSFVYNLRHFSKGASKSDFKEIVN